MSELYLIVADRALRAAIAEQLNLVFADSMRVHEGDNPAVSFPVPPQAIIIDALLAEEKLPGIVHDNGQKPKIFILGDAETGFGDTVVAESFPKPLRLGHLLARLQFHLRAAHAQGAPLAFGPFRLEPSARRVVVEETGAVIRLTEKETHLLEYLGRSEKPVAREELLAAIWGYDARIDTHTLETHIYRLRRKLEAEGKDADAILAGQGSDHLAASRPR